MKRVMEMVEQRSQLPSQILYTPSLTWAKVVNNGTVKVGLTHKVCECLKTLSEDGEGIVSCQLKPIGEGVKQMEPFGIVKTKKVTFELSSPISGKIKKVNEEVLANPTILSEHSEEVWIVEIEPVNLEEEVRNLLASSQYAEYSENIWYFIRMQL
jgi:glycine cleavage system H protein